MSGDHDHLADGDEAIAARGTDDPRADDERGAAGDDERGASADDRCEHRDVAWEPSPVVLWTDVESTVHRLRCTACGVETALIDHRRLPAL